MGEVYRARDLRLNRDVAIKVLPAGLAGDPDRLARFTREAQLLASLNHTNIATIHGIEQHAPLDDAQGPGSEHRTALVMELVEGDDLSAHIARGPMPLADALSIAKQIVDALEAAHETGIIHRDLKPQNIKVRGDGTVKVLDFGLAKALAVEGTTATADARSSPTVTGTQLGIILGTAAYMAPEQAMGKTVDKRADIWAFGVVLYEMLTGRQPFTAETIPETLAHVITRVVDLSTLPGTIPVHVRELIARCLEKDPKKRLRDIGDARLILADPSSPEPPAVARGAPAVAPSRRRLATAVWQTATVVSVVALAAGAGWYRSTRASGPVTRFVIPPQDDLTFTAGSRVGASVPVISPDGRSVAFTARDASGRQLLWIRRIDAIAAVPVPGTENAAYPFWSPDSRDVAYAIGGRLLRVSATGGPPQLVCDLNPGIISRGGSWNRDGVLIFNNGPAPLYRAPATGGQAVAMGKLAEGEGGRQFPSFLPDGRHFLYSGGSREDGTGVYVGSIDDDTVTRVVSAETGAAYDARSGRLLFVRHGTLLAQAFDLTSFAVSGDPVTVAQQVESSVVPGLVAFSLSNTGTLAYGIGEAADAGFLLTWVDRTGRVLGTVGPEGPYRGVALSPDGRQIAVHRHEGGGGDIWLIDVARGVASRLTLDPTRENASPAWSPDSKRIAFSYRHEGTAGLSVRTANNTGTEETLFEANLNLAAPSIMALGWSTDQRELLFSHHYDFWWLPLSGDRKPTALVESAFLESHGQLSPDGRWLAYMSNESTPSEVVVRSTTPGGGKWVISNGGGAAPRWRRDSGELFYVGSGKMWAVTMAAREAELNPSVPRALFDQSGIDNAAGHSTYFSYDVAADGQRFLMSRRKSGGDGSPVRATIVVVLNWLEAIAK